MGGRSRTSPERAPGGGVDARAADAPAHRRRRVEGRLGVGRARRDDRRAAHRRHAAPRGAGVECARRSRTRARGAASAGGRPSPDDRRAERAPPTARARRHRAGRPRRERDPHADRGHVRRDRAPTGGAPRAGDRARDRRAQRSRSGRVREQDARHPRGGGTAPPRRARPHRGAAFSAAPTVSSRPNSSRR